MSIIIKNTWRNSIRTGSQWVSESVIISDQWRIPFAESEINHWYYVEVSPCTNACLVCLPTSTRFCLTNVQSGNTIDGYFTADSKWITDWDLRQRKYLVVEGFQSSPLNLKYIDTVSPKGSDSRGPIVALRVVQQIFSPCLRSLSENPITDINNLCCTPVTPIHEFLVSNVGKM